MTRRDELSDEPDPRTEHSLFSSPSPTSSCHRQARTPATYAPAAPTRTQPAVELVHQHPVLLPPPSSTFHDHHARPPRSRLDRFDPVAPRRAVWHRHAREREPPGLAPRFPNPLAPGLSSCVAQRLLDAGLVSPALAPAPCHGQPQHEPAEAGAGRGRGRQGRRRQGLEARAPPVRVGRRGPLAQGLAQGPDPAPRLVAGPRAVPRQVRRVHRRRQDAEDLCHRLGLVGHCPRSPRRRQRRGEGRVRLFPLLAGRASSRG